MSPKRSRRTAESKAVKPAARKRRATVPAKGPANAGELLSADEAIRALNTSRPTFYRLLRTGRIKGLKVGRQWRFTREDIERFLKGQQPKVEVRGDIKPLLETLTARLAGLGGMDPSPADATEVQRVVGVFIALGVAMRASDVHLEPQDARAVARIRVDGVLHNVAEFDLRLLPALAEQVKRLAACDVLQKTFPQDGRILLRLPHKGGERELDIRVAIVPAVMGENVTMRILQRDEVFLDLDRIDFPPPVRERIDRALTRPWGLIVVTGPTGCGKTTTLYSCLNRLVDNSRKIMSVEDPVEYLLRGVVQVQIRPQEGLTFSRAVRSFLRCDPDIINIAEIRDAETLNVAVQAALTGHLVFTTLHTDEAVAAVSRMIDIDLSPFLVADAVKLIVAQRLVRRLCPECARPVTLAADELEVLRRVANEGGLTWDALELKFRRPAGCGACAGTGYRGRTILAEALEVTAAVAKAIREEASPGELRRVAVAGGMTTMAADGIRRAAAGQTTLEEVYRALCLTGPLRSVRTA